MSQLAIPPDGVTLRGLRRVEFERMVDKGLFVGEPVELLGGELVRMSPQGGRHGWAIQELTRQLAPLMSERRAVRVQLPLVLDDVSLPEPDVAITEAGDPFPSGHPSGAHVVFEVAETSQRYDLDHKAPRYAAAGVPLYVVLDLPGRRAIVHSDPAGDGYGRITELGSGDELDVLDVTLDLGRLLPAA